MKKTSQKSSLFPRSACFLFSESTVHITACFSNLVFQQMLSQPTNQQNVRPENYKKKPKYITVTCTGVYWNEHLAHKLISQK